MKPSERMALAAPRPAAEPLELPEPVFPQRPELLGKNVDLPARDPSSPYQRRWTPSLIYRAMNGWLFPYVKSRVLPGDFHPFIAYLFTEWKCNLDCK